MIGGVIVEEIIMDKLITPPKQATSLTWGPPPDPCKQAVSGRSRGEAQGACPPPLFSGKIKSVRGRKINAFTRHSSYLKVWMSSLPPPTPPKVASEARQTDTSRSGTAAKGGFFHPTHPSLLHPFLGGPCG